MKIDLHVHTCHSRRPAIWLLQKLGCPESFTDPVACYHSLKGMGMGKVTFTDHNTIEGCLAIAHLPDTFISEEITAYFPEDQCKVHVLAYDLTEEMHFEIQRVRENIYDLVDYLRRRQIPHAIAHAFSAVNDKFTRTHFEKLLLLFHTFEINGDQVCEVNENLRHVLDTLTEEELRQLSERHVIPLYGKEPWRKRLISGSDDHAGTGFGGSFTRVADAETLEDFFAGIGGGRATISVGCATGRSFARDIYAVAYRYIKDRFKLERYSGFDVLLRFADAALQPGTPKNYGLLTNLGFAINNLRQPKNPGADASLTGFIRSEAVRLIQETPGLRRMLDTPGGVRDGGQLWYDFVRRIAGLTLGNLAQSFVERLRGGQLFDLFHLVGSAGSLYLMLAPYFVAYPFYSAERRLARRITRELRGGGAADGHPETSVACFSDTFHEYNGVATALRQQLECAVMTGRPLRMVTCRDGAETHPGLRNFTPVYNWEMPEHGNLRLSFPPVLELLDYCFEEDFSCLQAATPGPVGLAALLIGRILGIPVFTTYHTAIADYVQAVTEDRSMSDLAWKYMVWFFNQTDLVQVSSQHALEKLAARGVIREKMRVCPRGVDCQLFTPQQRSLEVRAAYAGLPVTEVAEAGEGQQKAGPLILYSGRLARERGLDLLLTVFTRLLPEFPQARLILSGDGEYGHELELRMRQTPELTGRVVFPGGLPEQALAELYAACDVLVFPQAADTFGNGALEAQASGVPVVVSDDGGLRERMIDGVTGYVFPAGNAEALEQALLRVLHRTEAERRQMGVRARELAEGHEYGLAFERHWRQIAQLISGEWPGPDSAVDGAEKTAARSMSGHPEYRPDRGKGVGERLWQSAGRDWLEKAVQAR